MELSFPKIDTTSGQAMPTKTFSIVLGPNLYDLPRGYE